VSFEGKASHAKVLYYNKDKVNSHHKLLQQAHLSCGLWVDVEECAQLLLWGSPWFVNLVPKYKNWSTRHLFIC